MNIRKASAYLLGIFAVCAPFFVHAQTSPNLTAAQRAQLEAQLQQVLQEEAQANTQLKNAQSQSASLSRDIAILDAKIKAEQLDIQAKTLLIQTLGSDIVVKQGHIDDLEDSIAKGKQTLSDILRKTNELGQASLPEVVLSQSSVTGFFNDLDTFQQVQQGLADTFNQLRSDEASTSAEKDALTVKQNAAIDARYAIQEEQKNVKADEAQQKQLLAISKGNEASYSSVLAAKAAQEAQIRAALFALAGGGNAIPFGDALKFAQTASTRTGVPPAFLLAILTQESNLGKNVGTCYLTNPSTGAGVNTRTGVVVANVMKPGRDVEPFQQIVQSLGGDPAKQLVSCPQSIGYGGAMGPAQFIASTWMLLKDRVAKALGVANPNPWTPQDAIMAEAIFMADLGADSSSYTAQKNAACRYYSGTTCRSSNGSTSYGNSVMALASSIQQNQINPLVGL